MQSGVLLNEAERLLSRGFLRQAETLYSSIFAKDRACCEAARRLAQMSSARGELLQALQFLEEARLGSPHDDRLPVDIAVLLADSGNPLAACRSLEVSLRESPHLFAAWLLLGNLRNALGDEEGAFKAWYQSIARAQRSGHWIDESRTPPALRESVLQAIDKVRLGRRRHLFQSIEDLRAENGPQSVVRVERAVAAYLGELDAAPANPNQRPSFLYIPDLPAEPFLDPYLQPWARRLEGAFPDILAEFLEVLNLDCVLPPYLDLKAGQTFDRYLGGRSHSPAWDAFFFYRRGKRFDENHARCPAVSSILESLDLCRIPEQTPEICFSVLRPGTHILPHCGVTNSRSVMHLPLIIPKDCALNLVGVESREWKEGRLLMFDDTFEHEAWNHSNEVRVILLLDCWNPYLSSVERMAVANLVKAMGGFSGE